MIRQQFPEHIALVKEEAVDTAIMFRHCYIKVNDYSCLDIKISLLTLLVLVVLNRGISPGLLPSALYL